MQNSKTGVRMPELATTTTTDGFAVPENSSSGSMIVGRMLKFNNDAEYVFNKTEKLPAETTLVAVGVITAWVGWVGNKPAEHRITQEGQIHPDREDLPDQDQDLWPPGLNGEPSDPQRDTRYLHLVDPQTGMDFTFVTDTFGGRRAVSDLKNQIRNVRSAHPAALPILQLGSTTMSTKFGVRQRPEFKVVGWTGRQASQEVAPPLQVEQQKPAPRRQDDPISIGLPVKNSDMDDSIPF
jgi:hypothetical protein